MHTLRPLRGRELVSFVAGLAVAAVGALVVALVSAPDPEPFAGSAVGRAVEDCLSSTAGHLPSSFPTDAEATSITVTRDAQGWWQVLAEVDGHERTLRCTAVPDEHLGAMAVQFGTRER